MESKFEAFIREKKAENFTCTSHFEYIFHSVLVWFHSNVKILLKKETAGKEKTSFSFFSLFLNSKFVQFQQIESNFETLIWEKKLKTSVTHFEIYFSIAV